jgi:hypothetical protein
MRRLFIALTALLLAAAGYSAYWLVTARRLAAEIGPWAEAQRVQGVRLSWEHVAVEGFPSAFRLVFDHVAASGAKLQPMEITAPLLSAEATPWQLTRWRLDAPNGIAAALPVAQSGVAARSIEGTLSLAPDGTVIDLAAQGVAGNGVASGLGASAATAHVIVPPHPPADHRDTALSLTLRLTDATLPWQVPPFGKEIETLGIAGRVKGALPSGRLRDALAAWRNDGGTVELAEGTLRWGALSLSGSGTLALDEALQPIGALTATVENQNAIVDAAVAAGNLRAGDANLIKIALGLMAKTGPDGKKQITVPVSLQNDRVYLGPAQIAVLPRFTWE